MVWTFVLRNHAWNTCVYVIELCLGKPMGVQPKFTLRWMFVDNRKNVKEIRSVQAY